MIILFLFSIMKKTFILLSASLVLLFIYSCKKHVENKIEGDWRQVNVINPNSDVYIDWTLSEGYFYIIQSYSDSLKIDTLAYGQYIIKDKFPLFKRILFFFFYCFFLFTDSSYCWALSF